MSSATPIIYLLGYTHSVYNRNLGGITHADSIRVIPGGGNCINWISGHIMVSRDSQWKLLGFEPQAPVEISELYKRGSSNITPENAYDLSVLMGHYNTNHERLLDAVKSAALDQGSEQYERMLFQCFHESYHVGQLGLARRTLGFEGTIK